MLSLLCCKQGSKTLKIWAALTLVIFDFCNEAMCLPSREGRKVIESNDRTYLSGNSASINTRRNKLFNGIQCMSVGEAQKPEERPVNADGGNGSDAYGIAKYRKRTAHSFVDIQGH